MQLNVASFHRSKHLNEDKLELLNSSCPFCGLRNRQPVCVLQDNPKVLLLKCTNCNASSASRMPTDDALREYYASYYESPLHLDPSEDVTFDDSQRFAKHLVDTFSQYLSHPHVSILDFGGGDGSISYALAVQLLDSGFDTIDISIIDFDDNVVLSRNPRISVNKLSSIKDAGAPFKIVIASAIIEHLKRPDEILCDLLRCIDRGGMFYARTPYVVPLMKLCRFFGVRLDFTFPGHVHDLGQDFWETYFKRKTLPGKFQIVKSNPSIVQTTLDKHFLTTVAAYAFKSPWYLLGQRYKWVGGWEVFVRKDSDCIP